MSVQPQLSSDAEHSWHPVKGVYSDIKISQPIFDTHGKYSLPALLELGLSKNPQTRAAWWQARRVLAQKGQTESQFYPTVAANINAKRQQAGAVATQPTTKSDTWGPGLSVSYRLFQFGAGLADAKRAACALAAVNYNFNYTLQSVVFSIQKSYYEYASAIATIKARESSLMDAVASFEAVQKKQENGLARIQDVLLAKADKLQAEYELQAAEANLEACRAALASAVGVPVSKDFDIEVVFNDAAQLTESVEMLLEDALRNRADLLAQEANVHAAKWAHEKVKRSIWPTVDVMGSAGLLHHRHQTHWQRNYEIGVGLNWDIFTGFDTQYKALEQYSAMKGQAFAVQQQRLQVLREVWSEFHAFQSAVRLLNSAKALEAAAQESLASVRIGYDAGLNNLLDLLSAQKTLSEARQKRISSQSDLAIHWAQLAYVSGRLNPEYHP